MFMGALFLLFVFIYLKGGRDVKSNYNLSAEEKQEMIGFIQHYYEQQQGETIGNMDAMFLLDFIMEKLAPVFYNRGVEDSYQYMAMKIEDLIEDRKRVV